MRHYSADSDQNKNMIASHYRLNGIAKSHNACDIVSNEDPLIVNCAGCMTIKWPFTTDNKNGRSDYYLMYITSGGLAAIINDEETVIEKGDVILFPPNKRYSYSKIMDEPINYYWAHFTGYHAEKLMTACGINPNGGVYHIGFHDNLVQLFKIILNDFIINSNNRDFFTAVHLADFILNIGRLIHKDKSGENSRLYKSINYIHVNFNKNIRISDLAKMEYVSIPRYNVLFSEATGMSPLTYIITMRMDKASELIIATDLKIKQIAQMVGYSDPHYFSRVFKSYRGVSPESLRY